MPQEEPIDSWETFRKDLDALHEAVGRPVWTAVAERSGVARSTAHGYVRASKGRVGNGNWDPVKAFIVALIKYADDHPRTGPLSATQRDLTRWENRWTALDVSQQRREQEPAPPKVQPRGVGMLGGWDGAGMVVLSPEVSAEFAVWAADHPHLDRLADNVTTTGELGFPREASDLAEKLVTRTTAALGEGHPATLAARHAHSYWVGQAGDICTALDMADTLQRDCLRHLGADHALTLLARLRHAAWQHRNGRMVESRRAYAALARTTPPPPDDRFLILARLGRTQALGTSGQLEEARDQLEQLLPDISHAFGPHHPVTLHARIGHSYFTGRAGDPLRAYTLLTKLSEDVGEHFDRTHPVVLELRTYTVFSGWRVSPPDEGVRQARDLHQDCGDLLGDDHPTTLKAQSLLGIVLYDTDSTEARDVMTAAHRAQQRVLGTEHPDTLNSANNLAVAISAVEGAHAALDLCRTTLETQRRVLGSDHPDTLRTANNLANAISDMEGSEAALDLYRTTLEAQRRVLGSDHPDTLRTASNLAIAISDMEGSEAALDLYRTTLEAQRRVLGPDHPDTLRTAANLRWACGEAADEPEGS